MEVTENEFLPFPEGNDPGAGALDLQVLAEAIDASITGKIAHFRAIVNRPCRVRRLSVNAGNIPASTKTEIVNGTSNAAWLPEIYSNPGSNPIPDGSPFNPPGLGTTPGIYRIGACVISNPIGAVTAASLRQLEISAVIPSDPTAFPQTTVTRYARSVTFDTSTGGEFQMAELEVLTPFPSNNNTVFAGTQFTATIFHENVASNLQLLAGSTCWIYRVGDVEG